MEAFVTIGVFMLGVFFDRILRAESKISAFFSQAVGEIEKLQDNCLIYWSRDFCPSEDILLQARIRSNIERLNRFACVEEEVFCGNYEDIQIALDDLLEHSTGGTFESHDKKEEYSRCLAIISSCSQLDRLVRESESNLSLTTKMRYYFVSPIS